MAVGALAAAIVMLPGSTAWAGSVSQSLGQSSFRALAVDDANQHVFVSSPSDNAVLVHGSDLYVAESTAGAIEEIDLSTLTDQGSVAAGLNQPRWLAFAGGKLWTTVDPSSATPLR